MLLCALNCVLKFSKRQFFVQNTEYYLTLETNNTHVGFVVETIAPDAKEKSQGKVLYVKTVV